MSISQSTDKKVWAEAPTFLVMEAVSNTLAQPAGGDDGGVQELIS